MLEKCPRRTGNWKRPWLRNHKKIAKIAKIEHPVILAVWNGLRRVLISEDYSSTVVVDRIYDKRYFARPFNFGNFGNLPKSRDL